jgi:hypothetical protein
MASLAYGTLMVTNARFGQEMVKFSVHPRHIRVALIGGDDIDYDSSDDGIAGIPIPHLSASSCVWESNDTLRCFDTLTEHMKTSLRATRKVFLEQHGSNSSSSKSSINSRRHYINRRWLLMGDSTMHRLYTLAQLQSILMKRSVATMQQQQRPTTQQRDGPLLHCTNIYSQHVVIEWND